MSPYSIYSSHEAQIFPDNFYFILPTPLILDKLCFLLYLENMTAPVITLVKSMALLELKCPKLRLWLKTKPQVPPSKAQLSTLVS